MRADYSLGLKDCICSYGFLPYVKHEFPLLKAREKHQLQKANCMDGQASVIFCSVC